MSACGGIKKLKFIYSKLLRFTEKLPKHSAYRINVETIIYYRLSIVNGTNDVQEIENRICNGKIDSLVKQAYAELDLCQKMMCWKPWEPLIQKPPPNQWKWPSVIQ